MYLEEKNQENLVFKVLNSVGLGDVLYIPKVELDFVQ